MATRAIVTANWGGAANCQLAGWRALVDARFIKAWDDLAISAVEPNAFAESWFLRPALEQFDTANCVQLFCLWQDDLLCGLMPLIVQSRYGRWPIPHVENWLHHNAFLGTPLVRAGHEDTFWRSLLARIDASPGNALFLHLNGLACDGVLADVLQKLCLSQNRRCTMVKSSARAYLEQGLSPQAYFEFAVRAKKRKELRRQKNRLAEKGNLTFARDTSATGLAEWTEEFITLEQRGWKGQISSALGCAETTAALFSDVLAGAAMAGKLERLDLRLDGKPLAMLVNFICPPGSFSFKTTFDEEYARFSPGVLLQIENLALLDHPDVAWCDSCAIQGHPMIDSLWTGRREVGRFSVAVGGYGRQSVFGALLKAELARSAPRNPEPLNKAGGQG